eukprot:3891270-Rhodomonas_salina.1
MREDKKRRRDAGQDSGDPGRVHVVAFREHGLSSGGAPAASIESGGGSAASMAGSGRFNVEH